MTDTSEGRALLAAATAEGEWAAVGNDIGVVIWSSDGPGLDGPVMIGNAHRDDAAHIVWLHNNAEALLDAVDAVGRVRALHRASDALNDGSRVCLSCHAYTGFAEAYPCPVIRALDGES
ncbi:MAG TPA: hypothetical protein VF981_14150 [Gemmatimonadaceae bacterium]